MGETKENTLIVYFSLSGNVRKFVGKTGLENTLEIDHVNPFIEVNEPFVLIVPTYAKDSIEQIWDFMDFKENAKHCMGIAGSGNLNFNNLYCYTARDLSEQYDAPVFFDFEFSGFRKTTQKFLDALKGVKLEYWLKDK